MATTQKFTVEGSNNYAATVVRLPLAYTVKGLDNLLGVKVFGSQILTQKSASEHVGDLYLYFPAETALSPEFMRVNNLYRDPALNVDPTADPGYFDEKGRVKAIKLRGNRSDALLMPLSSLRAYGIFVELLNEGDTFDTINGQAICRKYEVPGKKALAPANSKSAKTAKAFKRVTTTVFPEHLDTDNFWRNKHLLDLRREVIFTQKLHGTSIRIGNVPAKRTKGFGERLVNRLGIKTPDYEFSMVYGSRKVIKDANNPNQNHYYGTDLWTEFGSKLDGKIPEGFVVYGELIGWVNKNGSPSPIQKGYTYDVPKGEARLYVYRVARIDEAGVMTDLPWDGVKEFCRERGLSWTPELFRYMADDSEVDPLDGVPYVDPEEIVNQVDALMDRRYAKEFPATVDPMVPLSGAKAVDEGLCLRQDALVPTILKAKSPVFLQHETKLLDADEADMESTGVAA